MKKRTILLIGKYKKVESDISRYQRKFCVLAINNLQELKSLNKDDFEKIEAIAFKGHTNLNFSIMKKFPSLKIISNFGVGYDTINVEDAKKLNILITFTPDILNDDVADMAIALYLGISRKLLDGYNWIKSGKWKSLGEMPLNRKVSGSKCGILGLGRIGFEIARRLESFKTEIHYYSRTKKNVSSNWVYYENPVELCKNVDNLFIALKGGEATKGFVSKNFLNALGKNGILINISRGPVVNNKALIKAINKKNFQIGFDVFEEEPINKNYLKILRKKNSIISAHNAYNTKEEVDFVHENTINNLIKGLKN